MRPLFPLLAAALALSCDNDVELEYYNVRPAVSVRLPEEGASFDEGDTVTFQALVEDESPEADLRIRVISDLQGLLSDTALPDQSGLVEFTTANLLPGNHVVTVEATDPGELTGSDSVGVTVIAVPDAPQVTLLSPGALDAAIEGDRFAILAEIFDDHDAEGSFAPTATSDRDGALCTLEPTGGIAYACAAALTPGLHLITVRAVDSEGLEGAATGYVDVTAIADLDTDGDGFSPNQGDCDDADDGAHPGATEWCNGADDDCDTVVDGPNPADGDAWYPDADDDGHGDIAADPLLLCESPGSGFVNINDDCDDTDPTVTPATPWFPDTDADGYGDDSLEPTFSCEALVGHVLNAEDCNDRDAGLNPNTQWFPDADRDSFGNAAGPVRRQCARPGGHVRDDSDCDDEDMTVYPGQTEICNEVDDDCNGVRDDEDDGLDPESTPWWYADDDEDGYGDGLTATQACIGPPGSIEVAGDCADDDATLNPETPWYPDADADTWGSDAGPVKYQCTSPAGHVRRNGDCNDTNAGFNPNTAWYPDGDGDGWGAPSGVKRQCTAPAGHVLKVGDCNDRNSMISPDDLEVCNSIDDNCNTFVDDADPEISTASQTAWYVDTDRDGYGATTGSILACVSPGSTYTAITGDCNDADATLNPNTAWYPDADVDTYGSTAGPVKRQCTAPRGHVRDGTDCNDGNAAISPGDPEVCNTIDDDCDTLVDDADATLNTTTGSTWYRDADGDSYGNPSVSVMACARPTGYVADKTDCNDSAAGIKPGAADAPDDTFTDSNCDTIDGDAAKAIFVLPTGSDTATGLSRTAPVATFARALAVAASNPTRTQVLVGTGTYNTSATTTLRSGVSMYGGYASTFLSRSNTRSTYSTTADIAMIASGLTAATTIDRIDWVTSDRSTAGAAATAVRVVSSGSHLTLRNTTLTAGRGAAGTSRGTAANGVVGGTGANAAGAAGGGGASPGGGAGATGLRRDDGPSGTAGTSYGTCGGTAGAGSGLAGMYCDDGDPMPGGDGGAGCAGSTGTHGTAGNAFGALSLGVWAPSNGTDGTDGGTGGGGGGGGAGGGEDCTFLGACTYCGTGRGGGGGGGGGTGGKAGLGGGGGGASIALAIHDSNVSTYNITLRTIGGGAGGTGGTRGTGGPGGPGGSGANSSENTEGDGGNGGAGGRGGDGGCGGGGGGGPSIGIWGSGTATVSASGSPVYDLGLAGAGGGSCGNAGAAGTRSSTRSVTVTVTGTPL